MDGRLLAEVKRIEDLYPIGYSKLKKELEETINLILPFWNLFNWHELDFSIVKDSYIEVSYSLSISLHLNSSKRSTIYIDVSLEVDEEDIYFSNMSHFKDGRQLWSHSGNLDEVITKSINSFRDSL